MAVPLLFPRLAAKCWRNPALWPELGRMTVRYARNLHFLPARRARTRARQRERREAERAEALAWCRERVIPPDELARRLPVPFTPIDVEAAFPDAFREARARVAACPLEEFGGIVNGGAANLDLLYSLARAVGARRVVETGVAFGWSTLALLLATGERDGARVFSVDLPHCFTTPDGRWRDGDDWVGAAVPQGLRERWTLFMMADREGLPRALRAAAPVDLAHYASDLTPEGCAFGYAATWRSLREGGAFIADGVERGPAFRRFAEGLGLDPVVVEGGDAGGGKFQGILFKQARHSHRVNTATDA